MIDIILFVAVLAIWYSGFWVGAKYGTLAELSKRIKTAWTSA